MAKTAVITGAGSGIGRMVTRALHADGWNVVVVGRRAEALRETVSAFDPETILVAPADVASEPAVKAAFDAAVERFGSIDLLFNNAGTFGGGGPVDTIDPDVWRSVVDVNLNGAFFCAQAAFRVMKSQQPQGGRIINNGSVSAQSPRPNAIAYTATKHAITGLTKALSLEGRQYGIACGQINIGNVATDMAKDLTVGMLQADGSKAAEPVMDIQSVIDALLYMAKLPLTANVLTMTVMATAMPLVGRG